MWVALHENVTAERGNSREVDTATGCYVFSLQKVYWFCPVSAVQRVVHNVHACPTSGASTCGLVKEHGREAVWRCALHHGVQYMLKIPSLLAT